MNTRRCKAPPGPVSLTELRSKTAPELIRVLEDALARVKEERVSAVCVVTIDANGDFDTEPAVPPEHLAAMVGALEVAKHTLIDESLKARDW